ncbi:MAG: hypothetical protein Q9216_005158, partial [Gyalolechia sp. 2 TL-2023]
IIKPSIAVRRKLDEVFTMETRVVEDARVRAEVKSAHMSALKARLSRKKSCLLM